MERTLLTSLIKAVALDTENPEKQVALADAYYAIGQTASAATYYHRGAERSKDDELTYRSLIRCALCYRRQGARWHTVNVLLKHAINLLPRRPEAYYLLSRQLEESQGFIDAFTLAKIGSSCEARPADSYLEFPGMFGLTFERAVSAWHWGKPKEARALFQELIDQRAELDQQHYAAVENNVRQLGAGPAGECDHTYWRGQETKLTFPGIELVERNFSQCYQDMFVLSALNGKRNGTFLELGSSEPWHNSNTALLEKFGWTGTSLELDAGAVERFKRERKATCIHGDARKQNYLKLVKELAVDGVIDYLQVDLDPPGVTFEALLAIPFEFVKFGVITYEHDYYGDITRSYRDKSRAFLKALGYVLVVENVSGNETSPFEDWWVRPELVDEAAIKRLRAVGQVTPIKQYVFALRAQLADAPALFTVL
jgi:tetratricopeptide (TPR) repeat protein